MVYLLHFEPAFKRIRHYAGATSDPIVSRTLERGELAHLHVPLVDAARAAGVAVTIARTWRTLYATVAELPYPGNRRKLCSICLERDGARVSR